LSSPEHREVARLLLDKAKEDLSAAQALIAAADQADHVVGFHLQQAVEKALKAVLASEAVEIPRTHDLAYIVESLADAGIELPESVASSEWLTPWGVLFRYDAGPAELDRAAGVDVATAAVALAADAISE
jgi:HEPN domain-containing protein